MKNIIDIYEGILGDIEDRINTNEVDVMFDELYNNLCNGNVQTFRESAMWLKSYFDERPELKASTSDLGVYRNNVYPKDKSKDYIEFIPGSPGGYLMKVIVDGMAFYLTSLYPFEKRFDKSCYVFKETMLHFERTRGENIYIVPKSLKPFIDRCINTIFKKAGVRKINVKR